MGQSTTKATLSVKLLGSGVSPETVRATELARLIVNIEKAITEMAIARSEIIPEKIAGFADVSLVKIEHESESLAFALAADVVPSTAAMLEKASSHDYYGLPKGTHEALFDIFKQASESHWAVSIEEDTALDFRGLTISELDPVPEPKVRTTKGQTTIYGRLIRVGGLSPRAKIMLPDDTPLYVDLTESLAKELESRKRLYNQIGLEGIATWNIDNWKILTFKVMRVTDYRPDEMNLVQAFEALADVAQGRWEGVDPVRFVNEQRGRGES